MASVSKLIRDRAAQRSEERRARAYRLRPDEGAADGVRCIARGQIDLARDQLSGNGEGDIGAGDPRGAQGVQARTRLLRLARDELGDEVYRRENAVVRDAGRALSAVRDAAVLVQALDDIVERYGEELPDGAFGGLRDALAEEARLAHDSVEDDHAAIEGVVATLDAARDRVARWSLPEGKDDGVFLAPGFKRLYRRGRRALRAAEEDTTTANLHELRKRAKDLGTPPGAAARRRPRSSSGWPSRADLSDVVGEDHDLAVLLEAATSGRRRSRRASGAADVRGTGGHAAQSARARQAGLRAQAAPDGQAHQRCVATVSRSSSCTQSSSLAPSMNPSCRVAR